MDFTIYKDKAIGNKANKMSADLLYKVERNISVRISWLIFKYLPFIRPTTVTTISILILIIVFLLNFIESQKHLSIVTLIQLILLYSVSITDKIDGELARAKDFITQKGLYYDHTVHFFYPFVFYFTIAIYFYISSKNLFVFSLTLLLSMISIYFFSFRKSSLLVREILKDKHLLIKDLIEKKSKIKIRHPFIIRFLDYLTFMIYAWTLFFYIGLVVLSNYYFDISYWIYVIHIIYTLAIISYRVFWNYPRTKLIKK